MTPSQLAGVAPTVFCAELPAAATTKAPRSFAMSIAVCSGRGHSALTPLRETFTMRAGFGLSGTFGIGSPTAHRMPAATSAVLPPHRPMMRTGRILESGAIPIDGRFVAPRAATVPATFVPCQELTRGWQSGCSTISLGLIPSPRSLGSGSHPSPSAALHESETKSYPGSTTPPGRPRPSLRRLQPKSVCAVMPVSRTATTTGVGVAGSPSCIGAAATGQVESARLAAVNAVNDRRMTSGYVYQWPGSHRVRGPLILQVSHGT